MQFTISNQNQQQLRLTNRKSLRKNAIAATHFFSLVQKAQKWGLFALYTCLKK